MTLFLHELRRNRLALIIWSAVIAWMLAICIVIYPEMESQMGEMSDMFAQMGAFSDAFGMDQLNFGEFMGYFAIECGNTFGIGGAIFAAILGAASLAKEEKDGTVELLLTHPISRVRVLTQKLLAVLAQIGILNLAVAGVSSLAILVIGVDADPKKLTLLFVANLCLQIEIAAINFCISAFLKRGGLGIGLGITFGAYFLNILANLTEDLEFIKYITPYGYTDGSQIVTDGALKLAPLLVGAGITALSVALAYARYLKKDIH